MGTFSGGRLKAMAPYVVTKANTRRQIGSFENNSEDNTFNTMMNLKFGFTFDLNGFEQSIDQIAMHADGNESGVLFARGDGSGMCIILR